MSAPFIAEIRIFGFNYAPRGWAFCNGQLLPIAQNTALFSLLGTTYGGNGTTTFGLPNLQGRAPLHPGQGPGLSPYVLGQSGGSENVTLTQNELPSHSHALNGITAPPPAVGTTPDPTQGLGRSSGGSAYGPAVNLAAMNLQALIAQGGNQPHNNRMPYLAMNFCIALQGIFPSRN